jgi:hypothetical protein
MEIKMQLPKTLLMSFTVFSIIGCGNAPKPTVCISSPKGATNYRCYDYSSSQWLQHSIADVDNWICFGPNDFDDILSACKSHTNMPSVNVCVVNSAANYYNCYDELSQKTNKVNYKDSENYICTSPRDENILLTYCKTIKN